MRRIRLKRNWKSLAEKHRLKKIPTLTGVGKQPLQHLENAKEFRVWIHPKTGDDYFVGFSSLEEALVNHGALVDMKKLAEPPLAVVWNKKIRGWAEVSIPAKIMNSARDRIIRDNL